MPPQLFPLRPELSIAGRLDREDIQALPTPSAWSPKLPGTAPTSPPSPAIAANLRWFYREVAQPPKVDNIARGLR